MCGIGGVAWWNDRRADRATLELLSEAQCHRGPDGRTFWVGDRAALAHNRLAIIDLATGDQPMSSPDGRYMIVYNGELYNFRELRAELEQSGDTFRTASDTEVVLLAYARWGSECLRRFRGMFAFGIWDTVSAELFLARDRLGIKPLHYWQTSAGVAFASELRGLLTLPWISRTVDPGALDLYLHYQYVPAPYTIFDGVRKLEPGCYLRVSAAAPLAQPQSYWSLRFDPDYSVSEEEWLGRLDATIGDAVNSHLVSDVPFGAFLSGGVDSTIVATHMARRLQHPLQTFTIGFDQESYDERRYAAATARALGAEHVEDVVHVDKYDLLDDLIFKLARQYGEPFSDSSAIPTFCVAAVAGKRVKMVLSGDGGDELFAGYNTYPAILSAMGGSSRLAKWWRRVHPASLRARALAPAGVDALVQHDIYYAHFDNERRRSLYVRERAELAAAHDRHEVIRRHFADAGRSDTLSALQYLDIKTYLPGDILTKVDVAAMAHSLEVRVPLLDHHVVELAARIPPELKLFAPDGSVSQKYLLKRYVNRLAGGDAFARGKQGFGVPIDRWFGGELYDRVRREITSTDGILASLFSSAAREQLVASPAAAAAHAPRIWSLLCLQAWSAEFKVAW